MPHLLSLIEKNAIPRTKYNEDLVFDIAMRVPLMQNSLRVAFCNSREDSFKLRSHLYLPSSFLYWTVQIILDFALTLTLFKFLLFGRWKLEILESLSFEATHEDYPQHIH